MKLAILSTLLAFASAEVTVLTPDNYESATAGKSVFIKFFAPWYVHGLLGRWISSVLILYFILKDLSNVMWTSLFFFECAVYIHYILRCGHCKSMAADWEKLANDYVNHASILIAEVDCTLEENDDLCQENGVQGFPTLKYGSAFFLDGELFFILS